MNTTEQQLILLDRSELEALALNTVSPELWYELNDTIDETTDLDLMRLISLGGDYAYERAMQDRLEGNSYADYVAESAEMGCAPIAAFEWRNMAV